MTCFRPHKTNIQVKFRLIKTFLLTFGYDNLIRYKIRELIADKSKQEGRKITLSFLAEQVGIQSSAMSKIANNTGYHTSVTTIEALCKFFDCKIEDVIEYLPED
ncbi:helix-turn-helix domain-containing protein [Vibrio mimicus]